MSSSFRVSAFGVRESRKGLGPVEATGTRLPHPGSDWAEQRQKRVKGPQAENWGLWHIWGGEKGEGGESAKDTGYGRCRCAL